MSVDIVLGELIRRELGVRGVSLDAGADGIPWVQIPALLKALPGKAGPRRGRPALPDPSDPEPEAGYLVMVNGRVVSPDELPGLRLRDRDQVSLQIMLSGG